MTHEVTHCTRVDIMSLPSTRSNILIQLAICRCLSGILLTCKLQVSVWDIAGAQSKRIRNPSHARDAHWSNERCIVSWSLKGLISRPPPSNYTLGTTEGSGRPCGAVQCAQTSYGTAASASPPALVVCGDADGNVVIMRYPSTKGGELGWHGKGHCGMVKDLCFGGGQNSIISVGGADACVFQWGIEGSSDLQSRDIGSRQTLMASSSGKNGALGRAGNENTAGDMTRMDSFSDGSDERLIEEGEARVRQLKEEIARRQWVEAFSSLEKALGLFKETHVKEERSWMLLKRAHIIQDGSVQDAAVLLDEIRDLATKGAITSQGSPANDKIEAARELFRVARRAPEVCGEGGNRVGGPDLLKSADEELACDPSHPFSSPFKCPVLFCISSLKNTTH